MGCKLATLTQEITWGLVTHSLFLANGLELVLGNVNPRSSDPPCVLQPLHLLPIPTPVSPSWPHSPPPCPLCSCPLLPHPTLGPKPDGLWAPLHLSWSSWGTTWSCSAVPSLPYPGDSTCAQTFPKVLCTRPPLLLLLFFLNQNGLISSLTEKTIRRASPVWLLTHLSLQPQTPLTCASMCPPPC